MSDIIPPGKTPPHGNVPPRRKPGARSADITPPPGKVPPRHRAPQTSPRFAGWHLAVVAGVFVLLIVAGAVWIFDGKSNRPADIAQQSTTTTTPQSIVDFDATASPPTPAPSATSATENIPDNNPIEPAGVCNPLCLARMPANDETDAFLRSFDAKTTYQHGDVAWVGIDDRMLTALEQEEKPFALIDGLSESARLYVVRLPEGVDRTALDGLGTIVDGIENQFLVDIPGPPPYVLDLVDRGISIEKLPPLLPVIRGHADKPDLVDPGLAAESISVDQLRQRVSDLQSMGVAPGELGSREYSQAGNVQAAEYLYRRLASYGLNVWYEDFIADNGRLLLNVVGELPGNDASQIYLMTAHFDSIADDTKEPALAPGALDNASGDAVLLEVARALSGYTLEHPVHFAFFNGEEYALQGAHAFARNASMQADRPYAGAFNVDSVGAALNQNQLYVNATKQSRFLSNLLVDANDRWGLGVSVWPSMSDKIKADDTELSNFGIPAVMVGSVLYGDPMINQSKDTIEAVDLWYLQAIGQLMTIAMATLVMPGG